MFGDMFAQMQQQQEALQRKLSEMRLTEASDGLNGGYSVEPETEFVFEIEAAGVEMLACELLDLVGKSVLRRELLVQPGPNRLAVPVAGLDAGAYTLQVSGADLTETLHFLKTAAAAPEFQPMVRGN